MIVYKLVLTAKGRLTQLPDSQKVFGALVYMFSRHYGDESAAGFVKAVLHREIFIALSNVLPLDYLPVPQDYLIDKVSDGIQNEDSKKKRAAIKARSYMQLADIEVALEKPEKAEEIYPYVKLETRQQPRVSIESLRYGIAELDSNIYSVPMVAVSEVCEGSSGEEEIKPVTAFCFYLQIEEREANGHFMRMLHDAVETKEVMILGKRASQGLNIFQLHKITKQQTLCNEKGTRYLNTGMLLPDLVDFGNSTLRLFTSQRRPYEIPGGWGAHFKEHYISFIAEGSVIAPREIKQAGKSIQSVFNPQRDIVFGNAFLYPMKAGR